MFGAASLGLDLQRVPTITQLYYIRLLQQPTKSAVPTACHAALSTASPVSWPKVNSTV